MARPQKFRCICSMPKSTGFVPITDSNTQNKDDSNYIKLTIDEYEVIRLIDYESFTHEDCAKRMNIARSTVTRIYESARKKIADSLVNSKPLIIEGGDVVVCNGLKPECMNSPNCCQRKLLNM